MRGRRSYADFGVSITRERRCEEEKRRNVRTSRFQTSFGTPVLRISLCQLYPQVRAIPVTYSQTGNKYSWVVGTHFGRSLPIQVLESALLERGGVRRNSSEMYVHTQSISARKSFLFGMRRLSKPVLSKNSKRTRANFSTSVGHIGPSSELHVKRATCCALSTKASPSRCKFSMYRSCAVRNPLNWPWVTANDDDDDEGEDDDENDDSG